MASPKAPTGAMAGSAAKTRIAAKAATGGSFPTAAKAGSEWF